jgi:hypothetical protein
MLPSSIFVRAEAGVPVVEDAVAAVLEHALLQLESRLLREAGGDDLVRGHPQAPDGVHDLAGQHARLARAGARSDDPLALQEHGCFLSRGHPKLPADLGGLCPVVVLGLLGGRRGEHDIRVGGVVRCLLQVVQKLKAVFLQLGALGGVPRRGVDGSFDIPQLAADLLGGRGARHDLLSLGGLDTQRLGCRQNPGAELRQALGGGQAGDGVEAAQGLGGFGGEGELLRRILLLAKELLQRVALAPGLRVYPVQGVADVAAAFGTLSAGGLLEVGDGPDVGGDGDELLLDAREHLREHLLAEHLTGFGEALGGLGALHHRKGFGVRLQSDVELRQVEEHPRRGSLVGPVLRGGFLVLVALHQAGNAIVHLALRNQRSSKGGDSHSIACLGYSRSGLVLNPAWRLLCGE